MEIKLPQNKKFIDKLLNGQITTIRLPKKDYKTGDILSLKIQRENPGSAKIGIKNVEYTMLHSITIEESEQEGFCIPELCPSLSICESIETRIDFDSLVFGQENGIKISRSREEIENELYNRIIKVCSSCLMKKDAKDLFLAYWKSTYGNTDNQEIAKMQVEVILKS